MKANNKASGKVVSNGTTFRTLLTVRRIAMVRYGRVFSCRCDAHGIECCCCCHCHRHSRWLACSRSLHRFQFTRCVADLLFHWLSQKNVWCAIATVLDEMRWKQKCAKRCVLRYGWHTHTRARAPSSNNKCVTIRCVRLRCIDQNTWPVRVAVCVACTERGKCVSALCFRCIRNQCYAYKWFIESRPKQQRCAVAATGAVDVDGLAQRRWMMNTAT